uniref:GAG-pre-integrase domain-containing protein n=1 Tax=Cajanus cajan TaxID=3821 RepID=A0A151U146_CAJCA|nr:hypothetical protein KK1_005624 [Cajanus cajan]
MIVQKCNFKTIGVAKKRHGLFYLMDSSDLNSSSNSCNILHKSSNVTTTDDSMLWHCRLGHPSNKVLQQLRSQYNKISFDCSNPCDTCHYAKQKKLPYSVSFTKSSRFFELIHVDIWARMVHLLLKDTDFSLRLWMILVDLHGFTY